MNLGIICTLRTYAENTSEPAVNTLHCWEHVPMAHGSLTASVTETLEQTTTPNVHKQGALLH